MPLVMMCGLPCSGKTRRAQQIAAHLSTVPEAQRMPIQIVNEESLNIQRDLAYKDSVSERMARGALKSAVERLLSADSILICDSMNYIKGFRYELFARARALNTQSCVVYCDTKADACRAYNEARSGDKYNDVLMSDLLGRMEVPSDRVKWDKPLFIVEEQFDAPVQEISDAILHGKAIKASLSTTPQLLADTNFLFELDGVTQDVEKAIMSAQPNVDLGGFIALPHTAEKLVLSRKVTLPELRRVRQQFMHMCKINPPRGGANQVATMFVKYLREVIE